MRLNEFLVIPPFWKILIVLNLDNKYTYKCFGQLNCYFFIVDLDLGYAFFIDSISMEFFSLNGKFLLNLNYISKFIGAYLEV